MARKLFRSRFLIILLLCVVCVGTLFYLLKDMDPKTTLPTDRKQVLLYVNNLIKHGNTKLAIEGQACRVPVLDVNAPEILSLISKHPKLVCNATKDWVEVNGSTAKITDWAKRTFGDIECSFTDIIREHDHRQYPGTTTTSHTEYNFEMSDTVSVSCTTKNQLSWEKIFMGIRSDQDILDKASWSKVPNDSLKLNLLMFGFDSVSHNMWKRLLPKTYNYATNDLKGIALNGYNIVGDGTTQAMVPILTGRTELELPDTRKTMGAKAEYVNVYPFVWNDFARNGYVTSWSEDMSNVGTFTYRLKGFNKQPVDHYMRTYYMETYNFFNYYYNEERPFCYGQLSRFEIMLNFIENVYNVYKDKPKFTFAFHSEYSHDSMDMVGMADDDTFKWLQDFNRRGYFNNTLLILMSDHGSRLGKARETLQGKLEERLPGFIFIFPSWFWQKYPEAYKNFKTNAERLTTPFDIHETIKNVLHFEGTGKGDTQNRGISLFKEIPLSRSCLDAAIEPHWCTCLKWETIPVTDEIVVQAVNYFIKFLNDFTSEHRNLCSELHLDSIQWSAKLTPNENLLKFKKNTDFEVFIGDMTDNTRVTVEIYQIKTTVNPGNMIFEASIRYNLDKKEFEVWEREISRVNKYSHMTRCIESRDILHHLRKYCYCV